MMGTGKEGRRPVEQEKIGQFLGQVRRERGLTQEQLAQRLGVSQRTVSRWETGRNMPDISMLTALCAQLDITVAELLAGQRMEGETITKTDASHLAERLIGLVRRKNGLRRILGALAALAVTLACMAGLYRYEFCVDVSSTAALEAAIDAWCADDGMGADVLERAAVGDRLYVLCRDEVHPGDGCLAVLERGLFGRYRMVGTDIFDEPLVIADIERVGGRDHLLTFCLSELPGVASVVIYDRYDDGFQSDPPAAVSTQRIEKMPFLHVERLAEGTSVAPFGAKYFDEAGQEIPRVDLLAGTDYDGGSSYGGGRIAEPWMVYVLEGLIALFGLVFIRYFLTM